MTLDRNDDIRLSEADANANDLDVRSDASEQEPEEIEVAEIRADIEETRVEMGGTLEELGDRLDPGHLMNEAKESVREATIGRVEETAKGMSDMVMETIKRNPVPAAMAGAGLALLWMNRSNGNGSSQHSGRFSPYYGTSSSAGQHTQWGERQEGIGDRAGQAVGSIGEGVGAVGEGVGSAVGQAGQTAQQVTGEVISRGQGMVQDVGWRLDRFMQASPIAVGAMAVGAGALIGALVPETRQEREMLGDASRQLGETVRDTLDEAGQQAEQKLDETERQMSEAGSTTG